MATPLIVGIYAIVHMPTGRRYVGQSVRVKERWWHHRSELRHNKHTAPYLQNCWSKYPESEFEFIILQKCSADDLTKYEQFWIDDTEPHLLLNTTRVAGAGYRRGLKLGPLPESTKLKLRGQKRSPETIARCRRSQSEGTKELIRQKAIGRRHSEEAKAKMRKRTMTPKMKEALARVVRKGKPLSEKVRLKLVGRPKTEEHRQKLRLATLAFYAKKRTAGRPSSKQLLLL